MKTVEIQKRFELSASPDNPDITVVYLYGFVSSSPWWSERDMVKAKDVREKLRDIATPEIHVHINSLGGEVFEGIAIHNLLKNHTAKVTCFVDGIAASAASVIAMAADKIVMPANTMLMIHRAHTMEWGNAAAMRKAAEDLEKIDAAVQASYTLRFVGTEEDLAALLDAETYLTAAEAKALGLCDEVTDEAKPPEADPSEGEPPKNAILQKYGFTNTVSQPEQKPQAKLVLSKCLEAFFSKREEKKE